MAIGPWRRRMRARPKRPTGGIVGGIAGEGQLEISSRALLHFSRHTQQAIRKMASSEAISWRAARTQTRIRRAALGNIFIRRYGLHSTSKWKLDIYAVGARTLSMLPSEWPSETRRRAAKYGARMSGAPTIYRIKRAQRLVCVGADR